MMFLGGRRGHRSMRERGRGHLSMRERGRGHLKPRATRDAEPDPTWQEPQHDLFFGTGNKWFPP